MSTLRRSVRGLFLSLALAVGARWIHNLGETSDAPIDVLSVILSALGFGGLVFGLSQIGGGGHGGSGSGFRIHGTRETSHVYERRQASRITEVRDRGAGSPPREK